MTTKHQDLDVLVTLSGEAERREYVRAMLKRVEKTKTHVQRDLDEAAAVAEHMFADSPDEYPDAAEMTSDEARERILAYIANGK